MCRMHTTNENLFGKSECHSIQIIVHINIIIHCSGVKCMRYTGNVRPSLMLDVKFEVGCLLFLTFS